MAATQEFTTEMLAHDDGPLIVRLAGAMMALAAVSVAARFWCRWTTRSIFAVDDWLVLAALPFVWMTCSMSFFANDNGGIGRYEALALRDNPKAVDNLLLYVWITEFSYVITLTLIKLSILSLYYRIFPTKFMRWSCLVIGGLCLLWGVIIFFMSIFQCIPVEKVWKYTMQGGYCLDRGTHFFTNAALHIVLDAVILVLPIVEVKRLQMPRSTKILIIGIFLMGGGIVVVSCIRIKYIAILLSAGTHADFTMLMVNPCNWTNIEATMAIVCASLPTMRPLVSWLNLPSCFKREGKPKPEQPGIVTFGQSGPKSSGLEGSDTQGSTMGSGSREELMLPEK